VAELARRHGLPLRFDEPTRDSDAARLVATLVPDLIFSFYYRRMIPMSVLGAARRGAFNMHGSLLPRYRGKAPVNWAVLHGEDRIGVSLHHMVARADAGDIVDQDGVSVGPDETAFEVMKRLVPWRGGCWRASSRRSRPGPLRGSLRMSRRRPISPAAGRRMADRLAPAGRYDQEPGAGGGPSYPGAFCSSGDRKLIVWRARLAAGNGLPGTVLSAAPLIVAAGEGHSK